MFENPVVLPAVLILVALGVFYLIATGRHALPEPEKKDEKGPPRRQVQCPSCQRWKKMRPIRREELLDEVEALKRSVLLTTPPRFLYEYKCQFCGHLWQEQYSE